jgi:hypothetical protein
MRGQPDELLGERTIRVYHRERFAVANVPCRSVGETHRGKRRESEHAAVAQPQTQRESDRRWGGGLVCPPTFADEKSATS